MAADSLPNWKLLEEISPNLVERGIAVTDTLQAILPSILAMNADDEKLDMETLRKVLRLSQQTLEYLLKTQEELIADRDKKAAQLKDQKAMLKQLAESILAKKKDSSSPTEMFKCTSCKKVFLNETFLVDHMQRRHKDNLPK